jgi:putative hydrolase of the HAD superfamily
MRDGFPEIDARRVRCVAFDLVGTLVYADPPVAAVYGAAGRRHGSRLSDAEIRRRFSEAYRLLETGDISASEPERLRTDEARERSRWEQIVSRVLDDVSDPQHCFSELFAWFGRPEAWKLYPDASETLRECAAAGYRIAIASNFDGRLHSVCDGHPDLCAVPARVVSSSVGYRKPSPLFYGALADAAGCTPEHVLMIGDDEWNDVRGAWRAGLQALRLDRRGEDACPGVLKSLSDLRDVLQFGRS